MLTNYNKAKIKEAFKKYAPIVINSDMIIGTLASCFRARYAMNNNHYKTYKHKVLYNIKSNNWLKIHHYPMRRNRALN